ncbi:MAG: glycosyltransferase family 2 protein [Planctomycetes bacterium]|nr:glycosyltransferase family 2 protein [Planctomycetota bacterium]
MRGRAPVTLGVLVPCRNEARVIERRLRNLLASAWPEAEGAHELLVIDDGSTDETARLAAEALSAADSTALKAAVLKSTLHPGKNGAIRAGLERLSGEVDVVVLTDADVVTDPGALMAIAEAFAKEPMLGMASGVQCLHSSLPSDGSAPAGETAMGLYDTWTRRVRRAESRRGRLFSVHGQLLAWRPELGLKPAELIADDLELMLELRRRHPAHTVRMIEGARFHEVRSTERSAQDLRRARAYLQATPHMDSPTLGLQGWLYRRLPPNAPALGLLALALSGAAAWAGWGALGLVSLAAVTGLLLAHPAVRRAASLLWVIQRARHTPRAGGRALTWETPRA